MHLEEFKSDSDGTLAFLSLSPSRNEATYTLADGMAGPAPHSEAVAQASPPQNLPAMQPVLCL